MSGTRIIHDITDLTPGDHLGWFYDTEEDHRAVITPFLCQGLERGEKVLYIVDARPPESVLAYLREDGLVVEPYLARGQLCILTSADTYLGQGVFDPDAMIALLRSETARALAGGYSALRVTGEMSWVTRGVRGSDRLIEYEAKLNAFFSESRCLGLCQYDRRRFQPELLLDVLRTHPKAVIGTEVYDNFYYSPVSEVLEGRDAGLELCRWIRNLTQRKQAEDALKESEDRYREMIDNANDIIFTCDLAWNLTSLNRVGEAITGYTRDEALTMNVAQVVAPGHVDLARQMLDRKLEEGGGTTYELEIITKDGHKVPLEASTCLIYKEGVPVGVQGIARDITERKQAEADIQSLAKFSSENPSPVLRIAGDGTLLYINPAGVSLLPDWHLQVGQAAPPALQEAVFQSINNGTMRVLDLEYGERMYSFFVAPVVNSGYTNLYGRDITEHKRAEEALRASQQQLRLAVESANVGLWDWNLQTNDVWFSPEWKRQIGYEEQELPGRYEEWESRLHPQDRGPVLALLRACLNPPWPVYEVEFRLQHKDGTYRWIYVRGEVFRDSQDQPLRMLGCHVDITERKRAEQSLVHSRDLLQSFVEHTPAAVAMTDKELRYVAVSRRWLHDYRLGDQNLIGRHHYEVFPEIRTRKEWQEVHQRCLAGAVERRDEDRFVRQDGREDWLRWEVRPWYDVSGEVGGIIMFTEVITERKRMEEALRKSEERYRTLYDENPSMFFTVDPQCMVLSVNQFGAKQLGYALEELVGRSILEFVHEDDREAVLKQLIASLQNPTQTFHREFRKVRKDGSTILVKELTRAVQGTSGDTVVLVVCEDISERKRAEETLHALYQASLQIQEPLGLQERLNRILETAQTVLKLDRINILLPDREGRWLQAVASIGTEDPVEVIRVPIGPEGGGIAQAFRTKQMVIWDGRGRVPDPLRLSPPYDQIEALRSQVFANVPLVVQGQAIGVLGADRKQSRRPLDSATLNLLQLFAAQAAVAIHNARLFDQVFAGRQRLQALSRRLVELQEAERRHIARELHDEISQILTGLKLAIEMGSRLPAGGVTVGLGEAQALANDLIGRVRELSLDLRPAMLDDLGVLPALVWHIERYTARTDIKVAFEQYGLERRFPPEVETATYRIVQEALTNVARHARVTEVVVRLLADQESVSVHVEDQGAGFDPGAAFASAGTSGLAGMRERATLLGGRLVVESVPGAGTRVTAELPLSDTLERRADAR